MTFLGLCSCAELAVIIWFCFDLERPHTMRCKSHLSRGILLVCVLSLWADCIMCGSSFLSPTQKPQVSSVCGYGNGIESGPRLEPCWHKTLDIQLCRHCNGNVWINESLKCKNVLSLSCFLFLESRRPENGSSGTES